MQIRRNFGSREGSEAASNFWGVDEKAENDNRK